MTYLDTHVVVWLYQGQIKRLSQTAARRIDQADQLLISPIVELELEYLNRRQKIAANATTIVGDLRGRIGLTLGDLPFPLVSHEALSISWTEDVFDRLIVAQASSTNSGLITADSVILEHYPHAIW